jgi:hypothetical protein
MLSACCAPAVGVAPASGPTTSSRTKATAIPSAVGCRGDATSRTASLSGRTSGTGARWPWPTVALRRSIVPAQERGRTRHRRAQAVARCRHPP